MGAAGGDRDHLIRSSWCPEENTSNGYNSFRGRRKTLLLKQHVCDPAGVTDMLLSVPFGTYSTPVGTNRSADAEMSGIRPRMVASGASSPGANGPPHPDRCRSMKYIPYVERSGHYRNIHRALLVDPTRNDGRPEPMGQAFQESCSDRERLRTSSTPRFRSPLTASAPSGPSCPAHLRW